MSLTMGCYLCGGLGTLERGGRWFECECERVDRLVKSIDPAFRRSEVRSEHFELPCVRMVSQSIWLRAYDRDANAVFKIITIQNWPARHIMFTDDADLKDVFVGSRSTENAKIRNERARKLTEREIVDSIQEYVDSPHLVVLRLGVLVTSNKEGAAVLEEAIRHRIRKDKPIWVYQPKDERWGVGSTSYSATVQYLLESCFVPIDIPQIATGLEGKTAVRNTTRSQSAAPTMAPTIAAPVETLITNKIQDPPPPAASHPAQSRPSRVKIRSAPDVDKVPGDTGIDPSLAGFGSGAGTSKKFRSRGD